MRPGVQKVLPDIEAAEYQRAFDAGKGAYTVNVQAVLKEESAMVDELVSTLDQKIRDRVYQSGATIAAAFLLLLTGIGENGVDSGTSALAFVVASFGLAQLPLARSGVKAQVRGRLEAGFGRIRESMDSDFKDAMLGLQGLTDDLLAPVDAFIKEEKVLVAKASEDVRSATDKLTALRRTVDRLGQ